MLSLSLLCARADDVPSLVGPAAALPAAAATAAAAKANATLGALAALDPVDVVPLLSGGAQSAKQGAQAAAQLVGLYATGGRTLGDDFTNATVKADLAAFTAARLELEARLRSGECVVVEERLL